jgi:hypothetical protein
LKVWKGAAEDGASRSREGGRRIDRDGQTDRGFAKALDPGPHGEAISNPKINPVAANRAALALQQLSGNLREWFNFYNSYDPTFTWWIAMPYKEADKALASYQRFLKEKLVGIAPDEKATIIDDPVGRDAFMAELQDNMIPYTRRS